MPAGLKPCGYCGTRCSPSAGFSALGANYSAPGSCTLAPFGPHNRCVSGLELADRSFVALERFVTNPNYRQDLSIDIDAPPKDVFPWLVQMGYQRGGLYSYDWLDRLFGFLDRPSANVILPEFQNLRPGDVIPIGRGGGFPVAAIDPNRSIVLAGSPDQDDVAWGWELTLEPVGARGTRLVSRTLGRMPPTWKSRAMLAVLRPAAFLMTHRMLRGIKQRAETLAAASAAPLGRVA